jgi:hypothetical protein
MYIHEYKYFEKTSLTAVHLLVVRYAKVTEVTCCTVLYSTVHMICFYINESTVCWLSSDNHIQCSGSGHFMRDPNPSFPFDMDPVPDPAPSVELDMTGRSLPSYLPLGGVVFSDRLRSCW